MGRLNRFGVSRSYGHLRLPRVCVAVLVAGGAMWCAWGCRDRGPDVPARTAVTIRGRTWRVELALTPQQRYRGLSGRDRLAADGGMLFVYPRPQVLEFCMRDCLVPLDIAFINADRCVVATATMEVEPDRVGRKAYTSDVPAQYALELPAGALAGAGVRAGDRVEFSPELPPAKAEDGP